MANINTTASLFRSLLLRPRNPSATFGACKSTSVPDLDLEAVEKDAAAAGLSPVVLHDEDFEQREQALERSRNKSRLLSQHRNLLNDAKPYAEAQSWIHNTVKYNRMQFGRYGLASGVDPRVCFPTAAEEATRAEFERVSHPLSAQEMMKICREEAVNKKRVKREREETILKKLDKLDQWTSELNAKVAKKEADAKAAKERKDRLVEEVRRQFGFKMDSRDERFKELLAQKEKEDKKKQKEAKRKQKDDRMLAKLQETHTAETKKEETTA